jgi:hypothetical protein
MEQQNQDQHQEQQQMQCSWSEDPKTIEAMSRRF